MNGGAGWGWFVLWALVGAAFAVGFLGALTIGVFVMPFALVGTVLLALRPAAGRAAPGVISGLAGPLFYVAFLNRDGPGNICHQTALGGGCTQEWSPWPFLGAGLVLAVLGCALFYLVQRRGVADDEEVKARWSAYLATLPPPPMPPGGQGRTLG